MATTMSKTQRLANALQTGKKFTTEQLQRKCGFTNRNSVSAAVYQLRSEMNIETINEKGTYKYVLAA